MDAADKSHSAVSSSIMETSRSTKTQEKLTFKDPSLEVAHSVQVRVSMLNKLARLGIVSDAISPWLFLPTSMTGCEIQWSLISKIPSPEQHYLATQMAQVAKTSIGFESHKEAWLTHLERSPVDVLVIEGTVRLPGPNHLV